MKLFPHRLRALSLVPLGLALAPGAGAGDEGPKQVGSGVVVVQVAAGSPAGDRHQRPPQPARRGAGAARRPDPLEAAPADRAGG